MIKQRSNRADCHKKRMELRDYKIRGITEMAKVGREAAESASSKRHVRRSRQMSESAPHSPIQARNGWKSPRGRSTSLPVSLDDDTGRRRGAEQKARLLPELARPSWRGFCLPRNLANLSGLCSSFWRSHQHSLGSKSQKAFGIDRTLSSCWAYHGCQVVLGE